MIGPFQARAYDPRQGARRLADLGMRQGDIEAEGALRSGSAWAQGIQGAAGAISKSLSDLGAYADEKPMREARDAELKARTSKAKREEGYNAVMDEMQGLGADEVIQGLRDRGYHEKAADLQEKLDKSRDRALDMHIKDLDVADKNLTHAASLMDAVAQATGAEAETYAQVAPKVRELVGPELGKMIPDAYDPAFVQKATQWGMSMKDKLSVRKDAASSLLSNNKDARDADKHFTEATAKWLTTVDSQDEWDETLANAAGLGASPKVLAQFGKEYSPEAVERVKGFLGKGKDDGPKAGSFEAFMTAWAGERKKPVAALTPAEQISARQAWEKAGWKPDVPKNDDGSLTKLTPESYQSIRSQIEQEYNAQLAPSEGGDDRLSMEARNTAMRWRSTQLGELDKAARRSGLDPTKLSKSMAAIGGANPPEWHAPLAPGVAPGPQGRVASGAPAPVRAPQARPSPEVEATLKQAGPGEYDLRDGSTWRVYPDGRMEKVK